MFEPGTNQRPVNFPFDLRFTILIMFGHVLSIRECYHRTDCKPAHQHVEYASRQCVCVFPRWSGHGHAPLMTSPFFPSPFSFLFSFVLYYLVVFFSSFRNLAT